MDSTNSADYNARFAAGLEEFKRFSAFVKQVGGGALDQAPKPKLVSLIVPVFNEEQVIDKYLSAIAPVLQALRDKHRLRSEVVFVDDGSTDGTRAFIESFCENCSWIRIVGLSRNFGKEAALTAGMSHATGDAVIPMDVDLQDPPELILDMVREWQAGAPIVQAIRTARGDDSFFKRSSANSFYSLIAKVSRLKIERNAGDFQLIDRVPLEELLAYPERVRFMKGLTASIGYSRAKVYFERPARAAGTTKWSPWKLWNFALDGITGLTTLPLRVWTYVGATVALLAFLAAAVLVVQTLLYGNQVPGYASTAVGILLLGGIQLIGLGVVGEYVGRISIEVRQRPLYHVNLIKGFDGSARGRR